MIESIVWIKCPYCSAKLKIRAGAKAFGKHRTVVDCYSEETESCGKFSVLETELAMNSRVMKIEGGGE